MKSIQFIKSIEYVYQKMCIKRKEFEEKYNNI